MVLYSSVGSELFLFYVFSDWWSSSFPGGGLLVAGAFLAK